MKDNILIERTIDLTDYVNKFYYDHCFGFWIYEAKLHILETLSNLEYDDVANMNLELTPIDKEVFEIRIKQIKEEILRRQNNE